MLEFGKLRGKLVSPRYILGDEPPTPDSSRYWKLADWTETEKQRKSLPIPYDKQYLRNWGREKGIDKLDPRNPMDLEFVAAQQVSAQILAATSIIYRKIFFLLIGFHLEKFQEVKMGIPS